MLKKSGIILVVAMLGFCISLSGCLFKPTTNVDPINPQYYPTDTRTPSITPTPFQPLTNTPSMVPPSLTPTTTFTPLPTDTPSPTDTPLPSPTPEMVEVPAGHVTAPILLYHHVSDEGYGNRYYVTVADFKAQMEALRDWGYTAITISRLANVLIYGGDLPSRPVVITFDDGNLDIYQNAFPIMRDLGFVGTNYIVGNRLNSKYFVSVQQLQEMNDAGWETGSHSMTHTDLTTDYSSINYEIRQSMLTLEEAIGDPVSSFAYPYGMTDDFISNKVSQYGYLDGMGLGAGYEHYLGILFYLSRMEIHGEYDLAKFASMLPWSNQ